MQPPDEPVVVNGTPVSTTMSTSERGLNPSRRRTIVILVIVLCLLVAGGGAAFLLSRKNQDMSITSASVQLNGGGFVPSTVQIDRGQGVTWVNKDKAAHQIFADQTATPHLDSVDMLLTGDSYTYVFEKPGTYHYYDPADATQLQGTVIVK